MAYQIENVDVQDITRRELICHRNIADYYSMLICKHQLKYMPLFVFI
jgi:hypothetical protein